MSVGSPVPSSIPVDALGIIHDAGGVGAIAHPRTVKETGQGGGKNWPKRASQASRCSLRSTARTSGPGYRAVARRNGLVECGGSDYHAFGYANEVKPGMYGPPPDTADLLFERAQAMHGSKACRVPAGTP